MEKRDKGGPAFPTEGAIRNGVQIVHHGMSLRDWFAGQALIGLSRSYANGEVDDYQPAHVAEDCYRLADALLEARK